MFENKVVYKSDSCTQLVARETSTYILPTIMLAFCKFLHAISNTWPGLTDLYYSVFLFTDIQTGFLIIVMICEVRVYFTTTKYIVTFLIFTSTYDYRTPIIKPGLRIQINLKIRPSFYHVQINLKIRSLFYHVQINLKIRPSYVFWLLWGQSQMPTYLILHQK